MSREIQIKFKLTGDSAEGRAFVDNLMKLGTVSGDASKRITELEQKLATLQSQLSNSKSKFTDFNGALAQFASSLREHVTTPIGTLSFSVGQLSNLIGVQNTVILGAAATMAKASIATFDFVKGQAEAAQTTTNLALRLGITADQAYNLQNMAKIAGVQVTGLQQAARILSVALEDQSGAGKKAAAILREMGIATIQASGAARDEGQVLMEVLDHLSKIPNTAQRVYEAQLLLGRGAKEIMPMIIQLPELNKALMEMHIQFGAAGEELNKAAQQINEMDVAWENLKKNLAAAVAPIVIHITRDITDIINGKPPAGGTAKTNPRVGTREAADALSWPAELSAEDFARATTSGQNGQELSGGTLKLGAKITGQIQAAYGNSLEGMQEQLKDVKAQLVESRAKAIPGISGERALIDKQEIADLERKQAKIEANIKARKEYNALIETLAKKDSIAEHERFAGPLGKLQAEEEDKLSILGALQSPGQLINGENGEKSYGPSILKAGRATDPNVKLLRDQFNQKRMELLSKALDEAEKEFDKQQKKPLTIKEEPRDNTIKEELDRRAVADFDLERRKLQVPNLQAEQQRAQLGRNLQLQTSLTEFAGGQKGGGGAVNQIDAAYKNIIAQATRLNALDKQSIADNKTRIDDLINKNRDLLTVDQADKELNDNALDAEIAQIKLKGDLDKQLDDAKYQRAEKIKELREKELEAERAGAGQVFDALFSRRPGEAFANLTKTFATTQIKNIFENIVTQPGGIAEKVSTSFSQIGAQSGIKPAFLKGGAFDPAKGGIKTAADELLAGNTSASVLNTTAINTLTSTLTGQPTGGASPVGIIPGAGLAGMIPGAGLAGMTPGAGLAGMTPPNLGPFNPGSIPGVGTFGSDVNGPLGITLPPFTGAGASNPFFTNAAQAAGLPASNPFFGDLSGLPAGEAGGNDNGVATFGVTGTDTGATDLSSLGFGKLPAPLPFNTTPGPSILQQIGMGTSSLASFGKGGGGGLFAGVMQGGYSGTNDNLSTSTERVANVVASAGAVVTGAAGVIKGIEQGGARGTLGAAGSALGVASLIPGPQQPFIAGAAALVGLIKNFLPDPRQQFARQQAATLAGIKYDQPQGISLNENTQGYLSSTNFRGQVENLGFKPQVSTYQQATGFLPNYPGPLGNLTGSTNYDFLQTQTQRQISYNNSGSQSPTIQVTIPVQTFDSKSFMDNSTAIGNALVQAIQQGHRVMNDITNKVRAF